MKVLSKPKYYKVKCNKCLSIIGFQLNEIIDNYDYTATIRCPICNKPINVGTLNESFSLSLSNDVEPIYEDEIND